MPTRCRADAGPGPAAQGGRPERELPWLMRTGLSLGGFDMGLGETLGGLMAVSRAQRIAITDGAQGALSPFGRPAFSARSLKVKVQGTRRRRRRLLRDARLHDGLGRQRRAGAAGGGSDQCRRRRGASGPRAGSWNFERVLTRAGAGLSGDLPVTSWGWIGKADAPCPVNAPRPNCRRRGRRPGSGHRSAAPVPGPSP